jgi:hypothetical protein
VVTEPEGAGSWPITPNAFIEYPQLEAILEVQTFMITKLETLVLVGFASLMLVGCCAMHRSHQDWVFKVEEINAYQQNVEKRINERTSEGWQFVSLSTTYNGPSSVAIATLVMKRHKE